MIISSYKYANVKHDFQLEILHNELVQSSAIKQKIRLSFVNIVNCNLFSVMLYNNKYSQCETDTAYW